MRFRVRDPVHDFIRLREDEVKILDTPAMQRLRGISQLAMANLVYPGAVHTRFDHSLGVTHVAGLMAEELLGGQDEDIELVRKAAILHDIGHGPFSHVSEASLERYANRESLEGGQKKEKIHELISADIIRTDPDLVRILGEDTCDRIAKLLGKGHGRPALKAIVSGPLDADKQDYLLRDSHFCGVPYGIFDIHQLHRSLTLEGKAEEEHLMIKAGGVHAVEQYALAKYYLTTMVYRHKVRLITDQMIARAIVLGVEKDGIAELHDLYAFDNTRQFVRSYLEWDDARFMHQFCLASAGTKCASVLKRLRRRKLLKMVFSRAAKDFAGEVRDILANLSQLDYKELRKQIEGEIAEELSQELQQNIEADLVILNSFTIRSVREMSRNDERGVLVAEEPEPRPFSEVSTLFASIDSRYADEVVEVYAPIEWNTIAEKKKTRRQVSNVVTAAISKCCRAKLKGEKG